MLHRGIFTGGMGIMGPNNTEPSKSVKKKVLPELSHKQKLM
jgi:hypothetical protein